jgi:hypothetical protein
MAIGARILSNNLSGQTANVTFLPTTGGTIDLGTQTIPFNNITSYPYGVYQIYVPLYDYTYELTINPPATNLTSFVFISKLTTNNNNGEAVLNFNDLTAVVYDLNVDRTGWYISDIFPITNKGYGLHFNNENTCDLQWFIFTDAAGNILESFQTNCDCDYDYGLLAGKWTYFADYFNGILKYFNGAEVYTLTADTTYQYVYIVDGWDGVTSTDNVIIGIDNYTANTVNYYTTSGTVLTQIGQTYDYANESVGVNTYFDGTFIQFLKYNYSLNVYDLLEVYDASTGNLLQSVDLTTFGNLTNYNNYRYGNNKFLTVLWNSSDSSVDYAIIQYNGNTDVLNTMTHNRLNYPDISVDTNANLYPNPGGSDAFSIVLYNQPTSNSVGPVVDYCDIIYMLSGDTTIQTYEFQNSGVADKTINTYMALNDSLFFACDNGDGELSILSITSSGITYNSTNLLMSNSPYISTMATCGNKFVGSFFDETSTYTSMSLIHILEDGTLGEVVNGIGLTSSYSRQESYAGDVYLFRNYSGDSYVINNTSSSFQTGIFSGTNYNWTYYPTYIFRPNFKVPGLMLIADYTSKEYRILSSSGITSLQTMPGNTDFDFRLGDSKFLFTFVDDISGLTNYYLYDLDINLINSATTEFSSYDSNQSCGDNFVGIINENNKYYINLISDTTIESVELTDYDSYYTFNDYVWWD